MSAANIFSEEFARATAAAGLRARRTALASGHGVVFVDESGRYVEELPDGTMLEVSLQPGAPRETHLRIIGEISTPVK
jgi:hypothetical protein